MSAADDIRRKHRHTIAAAERRAEADVQVGIRDLAAKLENAPEFAETGTASGRRRIEAVRGPLEGHARRLAAIHTELQQITGQRGA